MAQQITRLLPYRNYDEKDVIAEYSLDANSGEAGTFVKVLRADLTADPVEYSESTPWAGGLGNATSLYPTVTLKVTATTGTGDAGSVLGMMLRDVRSVDENGESLHYYARKKEELQCVVTGEAVPILTRGVVDLNAKAFVNGVVPNLNDKAVLATNGKLTGVPYASLSTEQKNAVVGTIIGTGIRTSGATTDAFAGKYARLKFSI